MLIFILTIIKVFKLVLNFRRRISHTHAIMLQCILSKIKSLLLGTLSLISRLLCCLKRRRRNSDPVIPVSLNSASRLVNEVAGATNWDDDDWDNCEVVIDKKPRTTSDHIAAYREQMTAVRQTSVTEEVPEPEPDLFADMAPDIKRQRRIFVGKDSPSQRQSSRLTAENIDPLITMGSELENWDEEGASRGWECDTEEMTEALRSHRKGKR